jgi:hypothetical protein
MRNDRLLPYDATPPRHITKENKMNHRKHFAVIVAGLVVMATSFVGLAKPASALTTGEAIDKALEPGNKCKIDWSGEALGKWIFVCPGGTIECPQVYEGQCKLVSRNPEIHPAPTTPIYVQNTKLASTEPAPPRITAPPTAPPVTQIKR